MTAAALGVLQSRRQDARCSFPRACVTCRRRSNRLTMLLLFLAALTLCLCCGTLPCFAS